MYRVEEKVCIQCNNCYIGNKTRKYCSHKCSKAAREKKKKITCEYCRKDYVVQEYRNSRFCSQSCKIESQKDNILTVECTNCNKTFGRRSGKINLTNNFCSKKCSEQYLQGSNHYEWKPNLHDKHTVLALKRWGRQIKQRDNYICKKCGETNKEILEAHHIIHRCNDVSKQFDLDNGITLCLTCHASEHQDDIKALRLIHNKIERYASNNNIIYT